MNIKDLESVAAVYKYKSFSAAADSMNFSVSSISKQIFRVEKELGVKLFIRKTKYRDIIITPEGDAIMPVLQSVIDAYSNLKYVADGVNSTETQSITIGFVPVIDTHNENEIICEFMRSHPEVDLNFKYGHRSELMNFLNAGEIDGAFLILPSINGNDVPFVESLLDGDLRFCVLMRSKNAYLGISAKHPLARQESIDLSKLSEECFIFSKMQDSSAHGSRVDRIERLVARQDYTIKKKFVDFANKDITLNLVENGYGVLPQLFKPDDSDKIKYLKIEKWEDESALLFIYRATNRSQTMKDFVRCAKSFAQRNKK